MKTRNYIALLLFGMILSACNAEIPTDLGGNPNGIEENFFDQPHRSRLGLKSNIKQIHETTLINLDESWETVDIKYMQFNADGNISYYDPTGIDYDTEENKVNKRWIGIEMNRFSYDYGTNGRLTKATISSIGEEISTYHLTYDNGNRYAPLPFKIGPLEFSLIKGLSDVSSNQDGFSCHFDNTTITYSLITNTWRDTWETRICYTYNVGAIYPTSCTITECSGNKSEISKEYTRYTFSENGHLSESTTERYEYGTLIEIEFKRYQSSIPYQIESKEITFADGSRSIWSYRYEEDGWISSISRTDENNNYSEIYIYPNVDSKGNWYVGEFIWNSHIDINHSDDVVKVERTLIYQ